MLACSRYLGPNQNLSTGFLEHGVLPALAMQQAAASPSIGGLSTVPTQQAPRPLSRVLEHHDGSSHIGTEVCGACCEPCYSCEALKPGLLPLATASQRHQHLAAMGEPAAARRPIYLQPEARESQAKSKDQ